MPQDRRCPLIPVTVSDRGGYLSRLSNARHERNHLECGTGTTNDKIHIHTPDLDLLRMRLLDGACRKREQLV